MPPTNRKRNFLVFIVLVFLLGLAGWYFLKDGKLIDKISDAKNKLESNNTRPITDTELQDVNQQISQNAVDGVSVKQETSANFQTKLAELPNPDSQEYKSKVIALGDACASQDNMPCIDLLVEKVGAQSDKSILVVAMDFKITILLAADDLDAAKTILAQMQSIVSDNALDSGIVDLRRSELHGGSSG